jgi:hypothetical protein
MVMARSKHPKKEVEIAVKDAEAAGWRIEQDGSGHCWGRMLCPYGKEPTHQRHQHSVWSTPKNPGNHAKQIRRQVERCASQHADEQAAQEPRAQEEEP